MFQWVEVQDCGDDLVGDRLARTEEGAKAIEGCIDENGITVGITSGLSSPISSWSEPVPDVLVEHIEKPIQET